MMSQKIYLVLSNSGHLFLQEDKNEALQVYISSKNWLEIDVNLFSKFLDHKTRRAERRIP